MENLHIFKNTNSKFSDPYINFINKYFDPKDHKFILIGKQKLDRQNSQKFVEFLFKIKDFTSLIFELYKSKKVILHGLFNPSIVILLFFQPWLLKKCNWVVWGGDLYHHKTRKRSIKSDIYEFLRKSIIKRFDGVITHIKGDYKLAVEWYGFKGNYYYSFLYPSNLYKENNLIRPKLNKEVINIQLGNSADSSNNHIEMLRKLSIFKCENIKIICPLSYGGSTKYIDEVIETGNNIFGDKFEPLIDFLDHDRYLKLLADIDIALFNHDRQQAVGNITSLLSLGKKIYIKENITTWDFCLSHGLTVYSIDNLDSLLKPLESKEKKNNKIVMEKNFTKEKLIFDWEKVFRSDSTLEE